MDDFFERRYVPVAGDVRVTVVQSAGELATAKPGAIYYKRGLLGNVKLVMINCPGCGQTSMIPIRAGGSWKESGWEWNGSVENPSLSPSVDMKDECGWHGHLRSGWWHEFRPIEYRTWKAPSKPVLNFTEQTQFRPDTEVWDTTQHDAPEDSGPVGYCPW